MNCVSVRSSASIRKRRPLEAVMAVRFIGIDPENPGGNCPAVFVDDESGDFLFQGTTVTDPATLARINESSPVLDHESVVRLPPRMRQIIMDALEANSERAGL